MPDGDVTGREAERVEWDVIVVGAGMGGGMLGHRLARAGRRVLFVEKGRSTLPGAPGTIRSAMPEIAEPQAARAKNTYFDTLARGGRSTDEITDISGRGPKRFVPFIGSGTGGSSALYGMVCERFFVDDFTPANTSPTPVSPPCRRRGRSLMTSWRRGTRRQRSCSGCAANPIPFGRRR